jgi:uncharacterized protein
VSRLRGKLARADGLAQRRRRVAKASAPVELAALRSQLDAVLAPVEAGQRSASLAVQAEEKATESTVSSTLELEQFATMFGTRSGSYAGCWVRHCDGLQQRLATMGGDGSKGIDQAWLALVGRQPGWESCSPEGALFIDTETTGLGGGTGCYAFLVGMAWFDQAAGQWQLEQLFLAEPDDEPALLERVQQRLEMATSVVSYNGKSFDLPLLRARFAMNRMPWPSERPHLDLLHTARRIHRHRDFPKNLISIEREVLGFDRGEDLGGAEVAASYLSYLRNGRCDQLDGVLLHNHHDVASMLILLRHYGRRAEEHPLLEICAMAAICWKAGQRRRARELADWVVKCSQQRRDVLPLALSLRARFAKSMGERELAIQDFEQLHTLVATGDDDATMAYEQPFSRTERRQLRQAAVRLELAKLYEHHRRQPVRALQIVDRGTGEAGSDWERRRQRLLRKIERAGDTDAAKNTAAAGFTRAPVAVT